MAEPLILVSGNELRCNGKTYRCAIGKDGLTENKHEGDHKTPIGVFSLRGCWYRADRMDAPVTQLPLRALEQNDGWCDDKGSLDYNRPVKLPYGHSHENLWREDEIYDLIIPLGYNDEETIPGKGSAIFLHVAHADYAGTEGCVALSREDLLALLPLFSTETEIEIIDED